MEDASQPDAHADRDLIPFSRFDTRGLPPHLAWAHWHESISVLFESRPRLSMEEGFFASVEAFLLGDVALGRATGAAQEFDRSARKLARDGMDGYMLQIYLGGQSVSRADGFAAKPGDMYLIDLAQPLATSTVPYENFSIVLPRRLLGPQLYRPDECHEAVLPAALPLVSLFRETLSSVYRHMPTLTPAQGQAVLRPLLDLAAVALNDHVDESMRASIDFALLARIRRHVEAALFDPGLEAEPVAAAFGLSRRKLYRLFEPLGGFMTYVRARRLRRARDALRARHMLELTIGEIGLRHGFPNPEHFARAFRQAFGMTPREARYTALPSGSQHTRDGTENTGTSWTKWVSQIAS